jgi:hypothetical protein
MLWLAADQSEIWTTVFGAEAAYIRPADDEPLCASSIIGTKSYRKCKKPAALLREVERFAVLDDDLYRKK